MTFFFTHDGHSYRKHSECPPDDTTRVVCDEADAQPERLEPLEPSGDDE